MLLKIRTRGVGEYEPGVVPLLHSGQAVLDLSDPPGCQDLDRGPIELEEPAAAFALRAEENDRLGVQEHDPLLDESRPASGSRACPRVTAAPEDSSGTSE